MRLLRGDEVQRLATLDGGFAACEAAYRYYGRARDVLSHPSSSFLRLPREKPVKCRLKGAHLADMGIAGARLATPGHYYCWLVDFESGAPLGLVDENWLHRRRTATTGALAAKWLARPGAKVAALVGLGKIGGEFAITLPHALPLEELRVAARSPESARAFAERHADAPAPLRAAGSIEEAVRGADIVVTITKATQAFIERGWLAPGAVLLSMGGCPEVRFEVLGEVDRLIVDDLDYAMAQGDLHTWVAQGLIEREALSARIDADIGEIAIGAKPGRTDPAERILAVVQGMAVCDIAMAKMVLDRAAAEGVGSVVEI